MFRPIVFLFLRVFFVSSVDRLPEESLTTPELITYWGYPVEVHTVTTEDGYVLQLHRIPYGRSGNGHSAVPSSPRPVFFLQHGLIASSADWVTNLPSQSLAFILADAGFDVWMGNVRGNFYSDAHINCTKLEKKFWEFTWDEMAFKDLPAMVEKSLKISGQPFLYYVGHSQGTSIIFAKLASENETFAKKIRKVFALAPVASVKNIDGLIAFLGRYFGRNLWALRFVFGTHDFLPHNWMSIMFAKIICGMSWRNVLCENVAFQIAGPESNQMNQSRLMVYAEHIPAGTSTWNIIHWAQMRNSGKMQMFDFGDKRINRKHYGQDSPPLYNLSRISVPIYLYYSDTDWLADARDIEETILRSVRPQFIKRALKVTNFNHFDFVWGLLAPGKIYKEIIGTVKRHEKAIGRNKN
ncbi:hypothetical protein niasHS_010669 [Heterodera schachtii]|uniref:Lipase n=1 Tax=Heterodera schachtii TaxID=97005 RepID=A0ABD2IS96_HETSC